MSKFYIKTTDSTTIIIGTTMFIDGDFLYMYNGELLYGMFRTDAIVDAHRTDKA